MAKNIQNDAVSFLEQIEAQKADSIKIKDVNNLLGKRVTITTSVKSIYPGGLLKTSTGRFYLRFTIGDETGQMTCTAWQEIAKPISKVLAIGQSIKIIRGNVETRRGPCNSYQITMGLDAIVEIYQDNGEIYVCNPRENLEEPLIQRQFEEKKEVKMVVEASKPKIGELLCPQNCQCIEMKVKKMGQQKISKNGGKYLDFIGFDDTGEICCILLEPHASTLAQTLQSGHRIQLEDVSFDIVMKEDSTESYYDLEIAVGKTSRVVFLPSLIETVSELKSPRMCESIILKVESMVTPNVIKPPNCEPYITFIGSDETGKICCTIVGHLCKEFGSLISPDKFMKLCNVKVQAIDPRCLIPDVGHEFEIVGNKESHLSFRTEQGVEFEKYLNMKPVALGTLDELKNHENCLVDFAALVYSFEMDTGEQDERSFTCRMRVMDESGVPVQLIIDNQDDVPSSLKAGTAFLFNKLQVRKVNGDWTLQFIRKISKIEFFPLP